jgi:hypothetical protein
MAPEMPAVQTSPKSDRLSSEAVLGILSSFPSKPMNTNVGDNFVTHNLDTKFALFGVRTWEIWRPQGRAANQKNLDDAEFMETKFLLPHGRSRARQVGACPQASPRA